MKLSDYKIVRANSEGVLKASIMALSEQGYSLQGGVGFDTHRNMYIQTMVKHEKETWEN